MILGYRIEKLRKALKLTQKEFGKQIAKGEVTIRNWEKDNTTPPKGIEYVLSSMFGASLAWLRTGKGKMFDVVPVHSATHGANVVNVKIWQRLDDFSQIPDEEIEPQTIIQLPEELVGDWRDGMEVIDDSMRPTLIEGDYVGFDRTDKNFREGELFVIFSPYQVYQVKRLEEVRSPGGIRIRSDNPFYPDEVIAHDLIQHDLKIIGRVAWMFGTRKKHDKT